MKKDKILDIEAVMDFASMSADPSQPELNFEDEAESNITPETETPEEIPERSTLFDSIGQMQIEIPTDMQINSSTLPVVRVELCCPMPYVPMSIPQTIPENDPIVKNAIKLGEPVILIFQNMEKYEVGKSKGLSRYGVWARIMQRIAEKEGTPELILVASGPRLKVDHFKASKAGVNAVVSVSEWSGPTSTREQMEIAAMFQEICDQVDVVNSLEGRVSGSPSEMLGKVDQGQFLATILFSLSLNPKVKNEILTNSSIKEVATDILYHLDNLRQLLELRKEINEKVTKKLDAGQRENFIQSQIEQLQKEIGQGSDSDITKLSQRAANKKWNDDTKEHFERELGKLRRLSPSSPDYSIQYAYLDTFLNLPWLERSKVDYSLEKIENTLNEDHYGLERVKERILEQMAVAALRQDNKSPILCLVGPPGVGKTSLGQSIARAIGREYARVALGGLHDEAEIRGHRRTYIGAMPGRIITALLKLKNSNPVLVLDEIDKIGKDFKGDPSTALLEVLDPEQNSHFHDNFVDADYDLSHILFIATANSLETVSRPLRDRMEIISIPGYISEEKIEIAKRHLVKKQLIANGLSDDNITFSDEAITYIIEYYTREAGVRRLEKVLGKLLRKIAVKKVRGESYPLEITKDIAKELLGKEEFNPEMYEQNNSTGVVVGLAWTEVGGEILFIESSVTEGKGNLTMTGNLGDVMKESATLALQYLKAHAGEIGLKQEVFDKSDVHIHVPEGAIPKDGPSAGITMATSLASSFTGRKVRPKIAMTGEITLRGKVLPVGGIREKIIAAKRAGIKDIILSKENKKDILEIKRDYLDGLSFIYVDTVSEVLKNSLF